MRILIVVDTMESAICKLADMVKKYNEHLLINIMSFHPKKYKQEDLDLYEKLAEAADLIDFEYFKSALILVEKFPKFKNKPKIITHHNAFALLESDWKDFDVSVVKNKSQLAVLPNAVHIPHAIDLDFYDYNNNYTKEKVIGMVANRIEGSKGIVEVAKACFDLNYTFLLVGRISKPEYFEEIMEANPNTEFIDTPDSDMLPELYKKMMVYVCNSIDNFESGPMPVLEAMSSGIPVLTRSVGLVPDIFDGKNMIVRLGDSSDLEDLKNELKHLVEDEATRLDIRKNAWNTVRHYSDIKMAILYGRLYNKVLFKEPLISVEMTTYNRSLQIEEILKSLDKQTYKNIEAIVADDSSNDGTRAVVDKMRQEVSYPIKYVCTNDYSEDGTHKYGLAKARNLAIIEAEGEAIVFCGSRLKPQPDAIEQFAKQIFKDDKRVWYFGDKGGHKESFTEGFSAIRRHHLVDMGMFNERISAYGGMTQDIVTRFKKFGFEFKFLPEAKADVILNTKSTNKRDEIWKMKLLLWKLYN